jgi:hypothetical protein
MTVPPGCVLYTQDPELVRRVKAFLRAITQVRHVEDPARLEAVLQQSSPALLIADLRARESRELLDQFHHEWPEVLIIALGTVHSEPLRDAEHSGIYAAEDLELDRRRFQALVVRAIDHLHLLEENRELKEEHSSAPGPEPPRRPEPVADRYGASTMPLLRFTRVFRRVENVDALLASIIEAVADAAGVTRVGIFSTIRSGDRYRLRAGLRCLPETQELEFTERDPLVRWFELHAHLINRADLGNVGERGQRSILRRALDGFGAEVMAPLYARSHIIGWLFFGHRLTGQRFAYPDLENLTTIAEQVSAVLENALLYDCRSKEPRRNSFEIDSTGNRRDGRGGNYSLVQPDRGRNPRTGQRSRFEQTGRIHRKQSCRISARHPRRQEQPFATALDRRQHPALIAG